MIFKILPVALIAASLSAAEPAPQIRVELIERMPEVPQPFNVIDWKARARRFDSIAFDAETSGRILPLVALRNDPVNIAAPSFEMPSYAGGEVYRGEAICTIAAVLSGSLAGIDKTTDRKQDWVRMSQEWFGPEHVVLNGPHGGSGGSFWYDILPGVIFSQLADRYPNVPGMTNDLLIMAGRWREAVDRMRGPDGLANFNYTGFALRDMTPRLNDRWREPDAAAGIGWIEYAAWKKSGDTNFLNAATACMDFLERRPATDASPLYECLLYYAPALAARMNAECGRHYDVAKLMNWCFSENKTNAAARPGWGILCDKFGDTDCHGLQGSTTDDGGYAFAMNTFQAAAAIAPLARYDARYARAIGKWMLNVANNARLFYPDALPDDQQSCPQIRKESRDAICYEGLRKLGLVLGIPATETYETGARIWAFDAPAWATNGRIHTSSIAAKIPHALVFSTSTSTNGPWRKLFSVPHESYKPGQKAYGGSYVPDIPAGGKIFFKLDANPKLVTNEAARLQLVSSTSVEIYMNWLSPKSPFAMGDAMRKPGKTKTDLAMYGAAHVGYLAALVDRTTADHVLQIDLLATDFFHGPAYPTFLYFNPDPEPRTIRVIVGGLPHDLYDTVARDFVGRGVKDAAEVSIPAHSARIIVIAPANGTVTHDEHRTLINGVVVDFGQAI